MILIFILILCIAALGVGDVDKRESQTSLGAGSFTKLGACSGGSTGSAASTAVPLLPRFHTNAVNTSSKEHQEKTTQKCQVNYSIICIY